MLSVNYLIILQKKIDQRYKLENEKRCIFTIWNSLVFVPSSCYKWVYEIKSFITKTIIDQFIFWEIHKILSEAIPINSMNWISENKHWLTRYTEKTRNKLMQISNVFVGNNWTLIVHLDNDIEKFTKEIMYQYGS